ncbi:S-layer homology domain-containing protein [Cohnella panacarvi]|uniref:CAP and S-layer homology domain-containing protein n=1 Tax=Cohnella panacarvi TaxID=400776 RepID=UPI00047A9F7C|nr:S-layer homology domain-containing protein [Cohnella panacarvi]
MFRRFTVFFIVFTLTFSLLPVFEAPHASATSGERSSGLPARTGEQIAAQWAKLMQPKADYRKPYSTAPATSKPYAAGALRNDYIQDGVNAINFYRFISGLPYDVTAAAELNKQAQHGAVLLAATGQFTHYPKPSSDMPQDFYEQGYAATTSSNIYSSYGYDDHIVARSIDAYMEDSDVGNLNRVGHRRWILNPPLQRVGLGQAEGNDGTSYSALKVFDSSRSASTPFHYVAYPAEGLFPIEVFKGTYAWSVSINPDEYAEPSLKNVKISLKRVADNKTWTLTSANNQATVGGAYMNVENSGYGSGPAIIFRPNGITAYTAGDKFEVTITGLKSTLGASQTIHYAVEFMSAARYVASSNAPGTTRFTDIAKHWAKPAIEWAAGQGIVSDIQGPFRPDDNVKEEEFLRMFLESADVTVAPAEAGARWSAKYYDYAENKGYNLPGIEREQLRPEPITRLSVAELVASAAGQAYTGDEAIRYLVDNGYSKGKTAATVAGYAGSDPLTRAEAAQFIRNLIEAGFTLLTRG